MWEAVTLFFALPLLFFTGQFYWRLGVWSCSSLAWAIDALKAKANDASTVEVSP